MVFKKTVDGVLAKFKQTVTDLRAIDEQQRAVAAGITDSIITLGTQRDAAVEEAQRARKIADKLDALLSS